MTRPDLDALSVLADHLRKRRVITGADGIAALIAYARELEGRIEKALAYVDQWDEKRMSPNIANLRAALSAVSAGEEEQ